jgi:hypothetical protein
MSHHFQSSVCGLAIVCLGTCLHSAAAQDLTSFAAIRRITLDPALSGTEDAHRQVTEVLRGFGEYQNLNPHLPEFLQSTPPLAYCTLRTDLPKPRVLGLTCRNAAGTYIGTLRARKVTELRDVLVHSLDPRATAGTLPLNQYRYLYVRPTTKSERNPWAGDYVAELLRKSGAWNVVSSRDQVPAGARLLECEVGAGVNWGDILVDSHVVEAAAALLLTDRDGGTVRSIERRCDWPAPRSCLRGAVRLLLEHRQRDEDIHQPLSPEPPRPRKAPSP